MDRDRRGRIDRLVGLAAVAVFALSQGVIARDYAAVPEPLPAVPAALAADAPRQARILGCISCHGPRLEGRLMEDIPNVVRVHAPNLTWIAARATDQQLAAAIRQGVGHDGRPLFVMPSPMYQRLSDAEVAALIGWLRRQPRVAGSIEGVTAGPIGRLAIARGTLRPAPSKLAEFRTRAPIGLGAEHATGHALVAKNCSECHGPSLDGMTMEDGHMAPDLAIAAAYDFDQFEAMIRSGRNPAGRDLGLMGMVARNDFAHYTRDELRAIHAYLGARAARLDR